MANSNSHLYEALLPESEKEYSTDRPHTQPGTSTSFTRWAVVFCTLCTLVNALLAFGPSFTPGPSQLTCRDPLASVKKADLGHLRRPSPYIGLQNIPRPDTPVPRSILNYPQTIALVDSAHGAKVFDDDPLRYMTRTGSVSPEERLVHVDKSLSTIVQFRAIDFGMELCQLRMRIPAESLNHTDPFIVSVYRLDSTRLDTKSLSYNTRPSRVTEVANIEVANEAVDWSRDFSCAWDELLTFEVACFAEDRPGYDKQRERCSLEWWQNKESEDPQQALFMVQHATI